MIAPTLRSAAVLAFLVTAAACAGKGRPADRSQHTPTTGSSVEEGEIGRSGEQTIEQILRGRVAGVWVTQTANGLAVRIRGQNSLHDDGAPLYVLDGVPIEAGPGGTLPGITAHDIESIRVLKDAASTAIYGVRGANCVILIKTKQQGS